MEVFPCSNHAELWPIPPFRHEILRLLREFGVPRFLPRVRLLGGLPADKNCGDAVDHQSAVLHSRSGQQTERYALSPCRDLECSATRLTKSLKALLRKRCPLYPIRQSIKRTDVRTAMRAAMDLGQRIFDFAIHALTSPILPRHICHAVRRRVFAWIRRIYQ